VLLVDSSVWVLAGLRLWSLAEHTGGDVVAICPPIVQELLQGTDDDRYDATRMLLHTARMLDDPMPLQRFEEGADIYLACRDRGFTIRSAHDCLIAASAIAHGIPVLCYDRDFVHIARVTRLKIVAPTRFSS
jgi:predicted nucleic acid-binding protein